MYKIFIAVVLVMFSLNSCAYNKSTNVRIAGKGLKVPIQGLGTIQGDEVDAIVSRQVNVSFEKGRRVLIEEKITPKTQSATILIGAECTTQ